MAGLGTIGQGMEQHNFGGHQTIESVKGVSHQTFGTIKGGGQNMDSGRYSYSEWHNFTHPRLGEVSILVLFPPTVYIIPSIKIFSKHE